MAWLVVCPFHKMGIFGLLYFFLILFFQPNIHGSSEEYNYSTRTALFKNKYAISGESIPSKELLLEINIFYQF